MAVRNPLQGKGIGRALMEFINDSQRYRLPVRYRCMQEPAQQDFTKMGYSISGMSHSFHLSRADEKRI